MELPKHNFSKEKCPLKTLFLGNKDTWDSVVTVIQDLKSKQLSYKHSSYKHRTIAEMINHALDTQYSFYTNNLVLGKKYQVLKLPLPKTADAAFHNILKIYKKTVDLWRGLGNKDLTKKIKTEWGQTLTGELALFQSITHTHYHLSEICFLRGLGGFPTDVMG